MLRPMSEIMQDVMADMESWQNGTALQGESTGFPDVDKTMRLNPGELILCAARPSMGKTALAMAIAENVARNNPLGSVLIFSAEMTSRSLGHRMVSARASVNGHRLRTSLADSSEFDQAFTAATDLGNLPIYIDESSSITTEQIYYRAAMANQKRKVKLIVFDFVESGADEPAKRSDGEEQRISMIARGLKAIAKNLNIPVLALSQLNRDCEKTQDKLPNLSHLRYSGMLEQVADVVMFIMRPEYYISKNQSCYLDESVSKLDYRDGKHPHASGVAYLMIAKQRNGPTGRVNLAYIGKYVKFASLGMN
jgi:replicative DNA helicase